MIDELWAIIAIAGFWIWVFSCVFFILRSFPRHQKFVARAAVKWGGVMIFSFCIWLLGMIKA